MKKAIMILLTVLAVACSSSKHSTATTSPGASGGATDEGTSYANAIVIKEKSEGKGVDAEYKWIREHYPKSRVKKQALVHENGKPYDILTIVTAEGQELPVYFDISNYFGKW